MMGRRKVERLSLALAGDEPPSEFRIFVAGWNDTEHGRFLFDDEAARLVMAHAAKKATDYAIDLEHQMLDGATSDPTARDARGWFRLELRGGELFAVAVRWTPDGRARLSEKRQRYVSPAFEVDPKTKRVTKIINVALTALPATHRTPALVAASVGGNMDPSLVQKALDALIEGDAEACAEILKGLIAAAASGGEATPPAEGAEDAPPPAEEEPDVTEESAARASLLRVTSTRSLVAAAGEVVRLKKQLQALSTANAAYENAERVHICRGMVHAGKAPASVWDQAAYKPGETPVPLPIFQKLSLQELREHAEREIATLTGGHRPVTKTPAFMPPVDRPEDEGPIDKYGNTAREIALCKEYGTDPAVYAKLKAGRSGQVST